MRIYQVMPGLAVSGMPKMRDLSAMGAFNWLFTLSKKLPPVDIQRAVANYHYIPIKDGRIDEEKVYQVVSLVTNACQTGDNVLIHCLAGRNRSMLVAALVWKTTHSASGMDAYLHVMSLRPNALHNQHFCDYLRGLS